MMITFERVSGYCGYRVTFVVRWRGTQAGVPVLLGSLSLCAVCDGEDEEFCTANAVENQVGSAANNQFENAGFNSWPAQVRTTSQRYHEGYDPDRETFGGTGLIESYERSSL